MIKILIKLIIIIKLLTIIKCDVLNFQKVYDLHAWIPIDATVGKHGDLYVDLNRCERSLFVNFSVNGDVLFTDKWYNDGNLDISSVINQDHCTDVTFEPATVNVCVRLNELEFSEQGGVHSCWSVKIEGITYVSNECLSLGNECKIEKCGECIANPKCGWCESKSICMTQDYNNSVSDNGQTDFSGSVCGWCEDGVMDDSPFNSDKPEFCPTNAPSSTGVQTSPPDSTENPKEKGTNTEEIKGHTKNNTQPDSKLVEILVGVVVGFIVAGVVTFFSCKHCKNKKSKNFVELN